MMFYNNIDIDFIAGNCRFHAINISFAAIKHNIPLHSHGANCYEIHYISDGYGTLSADGKEHSLIPNTLFVTGPMTVHSQFTDANDPMQEWCIYLRAEKSENEKYDDIVMKFLSEGFWIGTGSREILLLFQRLFSELENRFDGYLNMARLLISELIITVARKYINARGRAGEISGCVSERTSIIIEEYFLYEYRTASLKELSERLRLSSRQTQRIIEKYYGSTFGKKKNEARMSAAAVLLTDASVSLADISERLGYSSQEYFTSAFKKYYGTSPGRFRKNKTSKL